MTELVYGEEVMFNGEKFICCPDEHGTCIGCHFENDNDKCMDFNWLVGCHKRIFKKVNLNGDDIVL